MSSADVDYNFSMYLSTLSSNELGGWSFHFQYVPVIYCQFHTSRENIILISLMFTRGGSIELTICIFARYLTKSRTTSDHKLGSEYRCGTDGTHKICLGPSLVHVPNIRVYLDQRDQR